MKVAPQIAIEVSESLVAAQTRMAALGASLVDLYLDVKIIEQIFLIAYLPHLFFLNAMKIYYNIFQFLVLEDLFLDITFNLIFIVMYR